MQHIVIPFADSDLEGYRIIKALQRSIQQKDPARIEEDLKHLQARLLRDLRGDQLQISPSSS